MEPSKQAINYKQSLYIFGIFAFLLFLVTHIGIDILYNTTGLKKVLLWFINGGLFIFIPMLLLALLFAKKQGGTNYKELKSILRIKPLSGRETIATIIGLALIFMLSGLLAIVLPKIIKGFSAEASFMAMEPLKSGEYWILLCWVPLFILNIFGEELFWRGLILPLQENAMGKNTWWFHGICWAIFHLAFGIHLILLLLPIFFIQSYLVWKYKNTTIGLIIHGIYNGTGFLAVASGLI